MAVDVVNTVVYAEDWTVKLQERLDYPQNWKEVCRVDISNKRVLHNPYMSTVPSVQTHTRNTAYTYQPFANTDESVTINQSRILPMFIDRADLAQQTYERQMEMAELQGTLLNEYMETDMLANHAMWTNLTVDDIGGSGGGNITVAATNVDDIIRAVKKKIRDANGSNLMARNGAFIIWRSADFEILEAFVQANGFSTADNALKNGTIEGFRYMGVDHYVSNLHTSGHLFAGVKNIFHLGIVKDTYGAITVVDEPATSNGALSGIGVVSRIDWEFKAWTNTKSLIFDITVA